MVEKGAGIDRIVSELLINRGFDFAGYRPDMLERRIQKRIDETRTNSVIHYLEFLRNNECEWDSLIDVLTINVSQFFRDVVPFEFLAKKILPEYLLQRSTDKNNNLRIWSAGCATGEEPYTMSIILNEWFQKNKMAITASIFATDIDQKALQKAQEGKFTLQQIEKVRFGLVQKYFSEEEEWFIVDQTVKEMVNFSSFDLLTTQNYSPPDSIYGAFDIVLCRNVLIYFNKKYQKNIFNKLYKSLNINGYLILGESETIPDEYVHWFKRENSCVKIFKKIK
ncbi:MAG: protein-glutamate O-methyltransferase CheR [Prolixibacteraceae bacterium]